MLISQRSRGSATERSRELLDLVGVGHCRDRRPEEMSGGEQQRVAIGIAVANSPRWCSPTSRPAELDTATSADVFKALRTVNSELGVTIVVVTHDPLVSDPVDRTVAIRDGRGPAARCSGALRLGRDTGQHQVVAEEYAVLDRVGRLQLPESSRRTWR